MVYVYGKWVVIPICFHPRFNRKIGIYVPLAIRITRITRMMVGFIGMIFDSTSSSVIPTMDSMTMPMSSMFHLQIFSKYKKKIILRHSRITL